MSVPGNNLKSDSILNHSDTEATPEYEKLDSGPLCITAYDVVSLNLLRFNKIIRQVNLSCLL